MKHLSNTADQFSEHLWNRATYLIRNHSATQSSVWQAHDDGILLAKTPILMNLLNWWCKWTDSHGFGIFHQPGQDKVMHSYSVAVPFRHTTFACTFWVAAYATNHPVHFDLMQSNHSEVSLSMVAVICGWLIAAASDHQNKSLLQ
ncbi:hypothetical protein SCLCIDRAFT_127863 [Scleroderma citrinum Foug A]|uniref:Uncharacterized protein n=1 Tax=Scleroderma citrinum Foug A TaxID=1036808 RepID=A0A0C3DR18_9AGAM|nr:hypothetical protein SCLCIDRAFT_127863 [Scleroderma citrinum Foug A]